MSSDVFNSTSVIETSKVLRLVDTGAEKLVDVGNSRLTFVAEPKDSKDAVNKEHFDTNLSEYKKNIDDELQEAKSEFNTLYANAVDEFNALHRDADIKMTNINEGLADYTLKKQDFDIKVDETNQKLDTNLAQSNDIKTHIENRYNEIEVLKNETNSNLEQVRELKNDSDTKIADISSKIDLANADLAEFNEAKDGLGDIKQTIKELREVVDNGLIDDENLSTLKSYSSNKVDVTFAKKTEVIAKSQEIETQIQELETRTQSIIDEKLGLKLDTNIYSVDKATFATKEELNTKTEELTNSLTTKTNELETSLNTKTDELTASLNTKTDELTNSLNNRLNTKLDTSSLVGELGQSESLVVNQKALSEALNLKANKDDAKPANILLDALTSPIGITTLGTQFYCLTNQNQYILVDNSEVTTETTLQSLIDNEKVINITPIGVGQTWQDVTSQREANKNYVNTTDRAITVIIYIHSGYGTTSTVYLDDKPVAGIVGETARGFGGNAFLIVQPLSKYKSDGSASAWYELR